MQLAQLSQLVGRRAENKSQATIIQLQNPVFGDLATKFSWSFTYLWPCPRLEACVGCGLTGADYSPPLIYRNDAYDVMNTSKHRIYDPSKSLGGCALIHAYLGFVCNVNTTPILHIRIPAP